MKYIYLLGVLFFATLLQAQSTSYIHKKGKTSIVTVNAETYPGDDFLRVNSFRGEVDKVEWADATNIVEYTFLGWDGQTLFVKRTENDHVMNRKEVDELRFRIESGKPNEITLIGQAGQKEPLPVKVQVEVSNNGLKAKYLGALPLHLQ
ncbi:hypothetical protein [Flavobacterium selenitireducens]|uniref:hypothetical protein n=1 Tax=Flavobacterium selenitireducens TaxID=2722704 RepID=UPI00168BC52B|nr:hypothetical protein [Flavobacterium selenitireducens]MBD3582745.1 hypothetical protein [Flavobacterium selenitireducens]